jgi:hypothetical protein
VLVPPQLGRHPDPVGESSPPPTSSPARARGVGQERLAEVVAKHNPWLKDRNFLLVPYHMIEATSLESVVLGGYVRHVRKLRPDAPLPVVYRDEGLLADARDLRGALGDEAFIAGLPAAGGEWDEPDWDPASLDAALAAARRRRTPTAGRRPAGHALQAVRPGGQRHRRLRREPMSRPINHHFTLNGSRPVTLRQCHRSRNCSHSSVSRSSSS